MVIPFRIAQPLSDRSDGIPVNSTHRKLTRNKIQRKESFVFFLFSFQLILFVHGCFSAAAAAADVVVFHFVARDGKCLPLSTQLQTRARSEQPQHNPANASRCVFHVFFFLVFSFFVCTSTPFHIWFVAVRSLCALPHWSVRCLFWFWSILIHVEIPHTESEKNERQSVCEKPS